MGCALHALVGRMVFADVGLVPVVTTMVGLGWVKLLLVAGWKLFLLPAGSLGTVVGLYSTLVTVSPLEPDSLWAIVGDFTLGYATPCP